MSNPTDIVETDVRIPSLGNFYNSTVNTVVLVPDESFGNKAGKGLSNEQNGQVLLQQIDCGSKRIFVYPFIASLEEGGIEIPVIPPREDYVKARLADDEDLLTSLHSGIRLHEVHTEDTRTMYEDAAEYMKELEAQQLQLSQPEPIAEGADQTAQDAHKLLEDAYLSEMKRFDEHLVAARAEKELCYVTWMSHSDSLIKDKRSVREIQNKAMKYGNAQPQRGR